MIEMLVAAAETGVQVPGPITTYGPWGILIALGGWKGIAQGILWLQGRNANGNHRRMIDEKECDRRHAEEAKYRALEMGQLTKSLDALNSNVTRLHERFDEFLRGEH